jgi:tetratricopeptide repeat protein 30
LLKSIIVDKLAWCLQYLYDFLEAVITRQTSPEEAYRKLDEMATKQTETLRKLTKQVKDIF